MAIPLWRTAITQSQFQCQPFIHSLSVTFSPCTCMHETTKKSKRKMVLSCSTTSELNPLRSEVSFLVGAYLIPHPNKVDRGGEDAFFVSHYNGGVLAVADGVSGWAEENVDPSLFPRELMSNASSLVGDEEVNDDPRILMKKAHAATSSVGSATVIVAMLDKKGILKIANVGDCGLKVIHKGHVIFSTTPQEHYFDCPFQLSSEMVGQTYLDAMAEMYYLSSQNYLLTFHTQSNVQRVSNVELVEGDTIVMGSDGLFDNVFDHEIVSTIARCTDVADVAKALANLASNHAVDSDFDSPYSLEARSRGYDVPIWKKILGKKLIGGKLDDITVIVGRVVSHEIS